MLLKSFESVFLKDLLCFVGEEYCISVERYADLIDGRSNFIRGIFDQPSSDSCVSGCLHIFLICRQ